jgi:transposase
MPLESIKFHRRRAPAFPRTSPKTSKDAFNLSRELRDAASVPDHKTIADFRKDNGPAIRQVCARFVGLCSELGLLAAASVAVDGSKFKAVNNRDRNFTRAKMARRRAQIEESVARYLQQLGTADRQGPSDALAAKSTRLREKIAKLRDAMRRLADLEARMLASPDRQVSLTDPHARSMATSGRGSGVVGYNVQVAVEAAHHLIVAHEVTNVGSDRAQLATMAKAAKAVLRAERLDAVADRGYFDSEEILACEEAGITVTLPKPMTSGAKAVGRFGKQDFVYQPAADVYRCPAGETLKYYYTNVEDGLRLRRYWTNACPSCPIKRSARQPNSAGSPDGSMSTSSRRCSAGSTSIRRRCASGGRWSSIRSARSKPGWEPPTS